jgi:Holliday junction DNA helicase RuvB
MSEQPKRGAKVPSDGTATGVDRLRAAVDAPKTVVDVALRPPSFADFTGQARTVERLQVMVGAARRRGEALPHVLLSGPPGLGKTTLAFILGAELGRTVRVTSGPVIEKPGDLAGLLTGLAEGDILFVDEIHRLPRSVEEYLYTAMEDRRIDILIDQGPNARSVRLTLAAFTLVGATTRQGLLTAPLRSRFTLHTRLDYYGPEELTAIVRRSATLLGVAVEPEAAVEIARRCRGTPRIANNLLSFVRDYAMERRGGRVDRAAAAAALELLEIDARGLDEMDKRLMRTMAEHHGGGPVGIGTLAVAVGEEVQTLEEVHEPFLIQNGYLARTPQGRILTPAGYEAVGLVPRRGGELF